MDVLHILNGDATARPFRKSGIPGDLIIWHEILSEGPAPGNLSEEEFWRVRFNWLGTTYKEREEELESRIGGERIRLGQFREYSEVVLWFEHDLACQVNLAYLLSWFAQRPMASTQLSMVSIDSHPAVKGFKGLGELSPQQLAELYRMSKMLITGSHLHTAKKAWKAYSSSSPGELEALLAGDLTPLPFLRTALEAHMERFPSVHNGLNRIEQRILSIALEPVPAYEKEKLFAKFWETESIYGMGDLQIEGYMSDLSPSLLTTRFNIETTAKGKAVLYDNEMHYPADRWLGGVKLSQTDEAKWYWDTANKKLVQKS